MRKADGTSNSTPSMRWTASTRRAAPCSRSRTRKSGSRTGAYYCLRVRPGADALSQKQFEDIKEVVKPFDWSYSTDYKGSVPESPAFEPTITPIPLALLKRPDPILFFDDVMLYEDELADNGIAMLSCKIRVMPARLLLLMRFFMRLDDVLLRIRDTRVFVEFATGEVIREYTAREEKYETVRKALAGTKEDVLAIMRDPNRLSEYLPVVEKTSDRVVLK
jgi:type 2A phosphatase activator TIP41